MFNIVPAFVAIRVGCSVDRVPLGGVRWIAGCALVAAGGAMRPLNPCWASPALCAIAIGIGWMAIAASSQYAVDYSAAARIASEPLA